MLKNGAKGLLQRVPSVFEILIKHRERRLLKTYQRRREWYSGICIARGTSYEKKSTVREVRRLLGKRGYRPPQNRIGDVHTFAFIPRYGWHGQLYEGLAKLGPVTEFDYTALGYDWYREFSRDNEFGRHRRREMNERVLPALRAAHRRESVDWVFVYASGTEIMAQTLRSIQDELGIPIVGMCLDDKQSWAGHWMGDHRGGQIDIAATLDLAWTSARVACDWYLAEGGRPLFLLEGCCPVETRGVGRPEDIDVSFVGGAYGFRPSLVRFLERHGVAVETYGGGWKKGAVGDKEAEEIYCRSRINLGMGGIGYSETLTNVKGRDFEIPSLGGGMYLTTFNPDLATAFEIGKEIVCYRNRDELVELIRYYLAHPDEAEAIAAAGRRRCLAEHTWLHRFVTVCQVLGILDDTKSASELVAETADGVG